MAAPQLQTQYDEPELLIEDASAPHRPFIVDGWVKSYQNLMPPYAKTYGLSRWAWTELVADRLVNAGKTLVARLPGYPDAFFGFACATKGVLHYLYVKKDVRRMGIGRELVRHAIEQCGPIRRITHRPPRHLRAMVEQAGWRYEQLTKDELP